MFNRKKILEIQIETDLDDYSEDLPEGEKQEILDRILGKINEIKVIRAREQEECERLEEEQEQDRRDLVRGFHKNVLGY